MSVKNQFLILILNVFLSVVLFADNKMEYLDNFSGVKTIKITGTNAQTGISIPVPSRWKIKDVLLHLEFIPSKTLVSQRSVLTVYFNGVALYQQHLNTNIDIYSIDIKIPVFLIDEYNNLKIIATQHYCMNCCENEGAPELWTDILWSRSYIKFNYKEKLIRGNLTYLKDYVLDDKQYSPLHFGIILENKNDFFVTLGSKISGFIGKIIKYRTIYIENVKNILKDEDIILIGTKKFVKKYLNIKQIPNISILPNPIYPTKSILILTADNKKDLDKVINAFISINKSTLLGKYLNIKHFTKPKIKAYDSPNIIPLNKKIFFCDLGYKDLKFYNPNYKYDISFNISPDVYLYSNDRMILHLAYNYGEGARNDSIINIFLNGEFLKQLNANKPYGTLLEQTDIKIPMYLLVPGKNIITIQYGLMPTSPSGFCHAPNYKELQGSVFSDKSYIELPNMPHWIEMPYLELFTTSIYPFSIYPDLKKTQIYLSSKNDDLLSSLYTLSAYMGEKLLVPFYSLQVVSNIYDLNKSKNIIALGNNFPKDFYKNLPIKISNHNIILKYDIFTKIKNLIKSKILHLKEKKDLKVILSIKDNLTDETIFTEGESPFKDSKTILLITSNSYKDIFNSVKKLYTPKFVSKIKGDFVVVDKFTKGIYHANIGEKYFVGHLPLIEYLIYKLGFSFEWLLLYTVLVLMGLVLIIKILLDFRKKHLKE